MNTRVPSNLPRWTLLAAASLALLAGAPDARACACCAEPGARVEVTTPLSPFEKRELERLRFGNAAKLYVTAAGFDAVSGISDPSETYGVGLARQGGLWTFTFKDPKGNTGSLAFSVPGQIESFFVDIHDGKPSGGGGPLLYKEWRLTTPLAATGIFKAGAAGSLTARLVLQGRGNACTSAEQFSSWTLVVSGPKARYTLYGSLSAPAP